MQYIIELLEKAEHQVLNTSATDKDKQDIYCNINEALGLIRAQSSFLSLFAPACFFSPEELIQKATELETKPYEGSTIVTYLIHVAGKLSRTTNARLFYLKTPFSKEIRESLIDHNFKPAFGRTDIFIGSNGFHGSLLVVESADSTQEQGE